MAPTTKSDSCRKLQSLRASSAQQEGAKGGMTEGADGGRYQLGLLAQAPWSDSAANGQPLVFARRSGEEQRSLERVCVLSGTTAHLLAFDDAEGDNGTVADNQEHTSTTVQLSAAAECGDWDSTASYLVIGDCTGKLHFYLADGTLLFSQPLIKPVSSTALDGTAQASAFHALKFVTPPSSSTAAAAAELVVISKSGQLFHIGNIPLAELDLSKGPDSLRRLRAGLRVNVTTLSTVTDPAQQQQQPPSAISLALSWQPAQTLIYVVSGGISVWSCPRSSAQGIRLADSHAATALGGGGGDSGGGSSSGGGGGGDLFGGGAPSRLALCAGGQWAIVTDTAGGLAWWDARALLQLRRYAWRDRGAVVDCAPLPHGGGAPGPCVAAVFARGALCVLQLLLGGCAVLHSVSAPAATRVVAPSPHHHRFFAVACSGSSGGGGGGGTLSVARAREALPLHRMRALLSRGLLDAALALARAHGMDETELHVAQLAALLQQQQQQTTPEVAGSATAHDDDDDAAAERCTLLPESFYAHLEAALGRIGGGGLARACTLVREGRYPSISDAQRALALVQQLLAVASDATSALRLDVSRTMARLATFALLAAGGGGGGGMQRWQWFMGCDVPGFMADCLQAGNVHAAAVLWRRHAISLPPASASYDDGETATVTVSVTAVDPRVLEEGSRMVRGLPEMLHCIPITAPVRPLAAWLQAEQRRCRRARRGWRRAGAAAAVARSSGGGGTGAPDCGGGGGGGLQGGCNGVSGDDVGGFGELEGLAARLLDLAHLWDAHLLRLPLREYEGLAPEAVVFKALDRVQSPALLPQHVQQHALPLCARYGLSADDVLLAYARKCAAAVAGRSGAVAAERRAAAIARCISAQQARVAAALALARAAACNPDASPELTALVRDAQACAVSGSSSSSGGGGGVEADELAAAAPASGDNARAARAAALAAHGARVAAALQRVPKRDAVAVAQEALLFCLRWLEELEAQAGADGLPPGQISCASGAGGSGSAAAAAAAWTECEAAAVSAAATAADLCAFLRVECAHAAGRARALQVEFGLFPSVRTLSRRADLAWAMLRARLAAAELCWRGSTGSSSSSAQSASGAAAALPAPAKRWEVAPARSLGAQLVGARRLGELLGVKWSRIVRHLAHEATLAGRVQEALDLCSGNLKEGDDSDAALALRETAVALSAYVVAAASGKHGSTGGALPAPALRAAAESVFALRGSAAACSGEELAQTLELLQGSEVVAAVLSRSAVGEASANFNFVLQDFDRLLHGEQKAQHHLNAPALPQQPAPAPLGKGKGKAKAKHVASQLTAAPFGGSSVEDSENHQLNGGFLSTAAAAAGAAHAAAVEGGALHAEWYRGVGMVLPPAQSLALAGAFAMQELRARRCSNGGSSGGGGGGGSEAAALGLTSAAMRLSEFLLGRGAQQLCLRVLAGMSLVPPQALPAFHAALAGLAEKVLSSSSVDATLGLGYMLALPVVDAFQVFRGVMSRPDGDYARRRGLAALGMDLARIWDNPNVLAQCTELERRYFKFTVSVMKLKFTGACSRRLAALGMDLARVWDNPNVLAQCTEPERSKGWQSACKDMVHVWDNPNVLAQCTELEHSAHWMHVLSSLDIPIEWRKFQAPGGGGAAKPAALAERDRYMRGLVQPLLASSGGDLSLALEFCDHFNIEEACPCFLYVEQQLTGGDARYQEHILSVLPDVHCHHLVRLLNHLLTLSEGGILDTDYERLAFAYGLLMERVPQGTPEWQQCDNAQAILTVLRSYRSPLPLDASGAPLPPRPHPPSGEEDPPSKRIPFRPLQQRPMEVLLPQLTPDTVAQLLPLAAPLGLQPGDLYAGLIRSLLGAPAAFDAAMRWLPSIKSMPLACLTAQWVALRVTAPATVDTAAVAAAPAPAEAAAARAAAMELAAMQRAADCARNAARNGTVPALPLLDPRLRARAGVEGEGDVETGCVVKVLADWLAELQLRAVIVEFLGERAVRELAAYLGSSRAFYKLAEQKGYTGQQCEDLRRRLMRGWIMRKGGHGQEGVKGDREGGLDLMGDEGSIFERGEREVRLEADAVAAMQIAFVATVTSSYDADGGSDYIARMNLHSTIEHLLKDYVAPPAAARALPPRCRLRALCAAAVLADGALLAELWGAARGGAAGLKTQTETIVLAAELEAARLPLSLADAEAASGGSGAALAHALLREHGGERGAAAALACALLLRARCADAALWGSALRSAAASAASARELLVGVLPQLSHAGLLSSAEGGGGGGAAAAAAWSAVMRRPVEELLLRQARDLRARALQQKMCCGAGSSSGAAGSGGSGATGSSTWSFGASLFYTNADDAPGGGAVVATDASNNPAVSTSGSSELQLYGWPAAAVMGVLGQVINLLRCCPFPEAADTPWFAQSLAALGAAFHAHAVRAAQCITAPQLRRRALLACLEHGCDAALLLDELAGGSSGGSSGSGGAAACGDAASVFEAVDAAGRHAELQGTRHFEAMARHVAVRGCPREVVRKCLKLKKVEEAAHLCELYYSAQGADSAAAGGDDMGALDRFVHAFGLENVSDSDSDL
ncbi:hypothetical protein JKP88DRAFT_292744 [Tribonema minus]|uniref:KNTC1 third ARM-repeats domain-containing protein n=1 Tax=Tribonema minus TaxID=303371 RepID=A0A835ZDW9_9STRA|nr:hypothetical protein JKP88DRAFT_292744 [Tribonema minus]